MASPEQDYANAAARILENLGASQAVAVAQRGQIWGNTFRDIGQTVANLPGQLAQAKELQMRQQIQQSQLDEIKRLQAGRVALGDAIKANLSTDPQTGQVTGYDKVANAVSAAGYPEQAESWLKTATGNQENLAKLRDLTVNHQKAQMSMIGDLAYKAKTPQDWISSVGVLATAGLLDEQQAHQIAALAGTPDAEQMRQQYLQFSPTWQKEQEELKKPRELKPNMTLTTAERALSGQAPLISTPPTPLEQAQTAEATARVPLIGAQTAEAQAALPLKAAEAQKAGAEAKKATVEANQLESVTGGGAGAAVPEVAPGQKNEAFLQTLPDGIAKQVKALAEGRMQFPSSFALKTPYWQGILQAVAKYDPSFDAINYNARSATRKDFTSGKSAQSVNAMNTVVGHLSELSDKADALQNSPYQFVNSVKNWMKTKAGSPVVTNFETAKKAVADELTRVYRQAGGAEADVKAWQASLNAANSPEQLHGAFATIGDLLESKLQAMQNQYEQGMGTSDIQMITPKARLGLDKLEGKAGAGAAPSRSALPPPPPGKIRAFDPQGHPHLADKGTPLPPGWRLE